MNKFELGQRVKVVANEYGEADTDLLGETGVIESVFNHGTDDASYGVFIDPEFPESHKYGALHFEGVELELIK